MELTMRLVDPALYESWTDAERERFWEYVGQFGFVRERFAEYQRGQFGF